MSLHSKKSVLIEYCRKLYDKGCLPGIDGNVSLRADDNTIIITPSAKSKDIVTEDDLVLVGLDGKTLDNGKKPSIETPMHIAAYRHAPETNAVVHMHSPCATAFAIARRNIDTKHAPFAYVHLGEIGYVGYSTPGSKVFHEDVAACIKNGHIVLLLESHGSMVLSGDMPSAYAKADLLENYAKMLIYAQLIGGAQTLSEKELSDIFAG